MAEQKKLFMDTDLQEVANTAVTENTRIVKEKFISSFTTLEYQLSILIINIDKQKKEIAKEINDPILNDTRIAQLMSRYIETVNDFMLLKMQERKIWTELLIRSFEVNTIDENSDNREEA